MSRSVIEIIRKDADRRTMQDLQVVIPWLKKKSELLQGLENAVLEEIVRGCEYLQSPCDHVVIRQGDRGDCMFILLSGSVSVYIDDGKSHEEDSLESEEASNWESKPTHRDRRADRLDRRADRLDRTAFGKFTVKFDTGKSFGEIALISEDCIRNASIVSDETTHFLVIRRHLFNRTLKEHQKKEFQSRREFARTMPYFSKWSRHSQRQLEMSLIRGVYAYEQPIVRQGDPWRGLIFIRGGRAQITVEPARHEAQYPHMYPLLNAPEACSVQLKSQLNKSTYEGKVKSQADVRQDRVFVRRKKGYAEAERRLNLRQVNVCSVGEGETIGDVEVVMNMNTYMQTVICTCETEVYTLTVKNFERLITRRNPATMEALRQLSIVKMSSRAEALKEKAVPLYGHLLYRLTQELRPDSVRRMPPVAEANFKELPPKEELFNHMLTMFVRNKAQVCEPHVPGSAYYKDIMREKARIRESIRQHRNIAKTRRPVWYSKRRHSVVPRSIRTIRAALQKQKEGTGNHQQMALMRQLRALEELELRAEYEDKEEEVKRKMFLMGPDFTKDSVCLPAIQDALPEEKDAGQPQFMYGEPFNQMPSSEPDTVAETTNNVVNISRIQDSTHAQMMTQAEPVLANVEGCRDTKSDPDIVLPTVYEYVEGQEVGAARPASAAQDRGQGNNREFAGMASRSASPAPSGALGRKEHALYLKAMTSRRMPHSDETPAYRDWETSEKSLSYLEKRLQEFRPTEGQNSSDDGSKRSLVAVSLPRLKRFEAGDDAEQPRPGGRVVVRRRACALSTSKYQPVNHEHYRYHMLPVIPNYENLKRTKMLLHMAVDDARSKWKPGGTGTEI